MFWNCFDSLTICSTFLTTCSTCFEEFFDFMTICLTCLTEWFTRFWPIPNHEQFSIRRILTIVWSFADHVSIIVQQTNGKLYEQLTRSGRTSFAHCSKIGPTLVQKCSKHGANILQTWCKHPLNMSHTGHLCRESYSIQLRPLASFWGPKNGDHLSNLSPHTPPCFGTLLSGLVGFVAGL